MSRELLYGADPDLEIHRVWIFLSLLFSLLSRSLFYWCSLHGDIWIPYIFLFFFIFVLIYHSPVSIVSYNFTGRKRMRGRDSRESTNQGSSEPPDVSVW